MYFLKKIFIKIYCISFFILQAKLVSLMKNLSTHQRALQNTKDALFRSITIKIVVKNIKYRSNRF